MFTGIIEQIGIVRLHEKNALSHRLVISAKFNNLTIGESIAVNGVCLTLLDGEPGTLSFDISPETLKVTQLRDLQEGDSVNLERAMQADKRMGGHYVTGHVDTTARIHSITKIDDYCEMEVSGFSAYDMLHLIPKGSITISGVSLTINSVFDDKIKIMLIPHTLAETTLSLYRQDCLVNIEFDYLARIVAHQLERLGFKA